MTKLIFGINVPYQSQRAVFVGPGIERIWEPCIRTHKIMFFEICDVCGSNIPSGRLSRGIPTCSPTCNKKKWDKINRKKEEEESVVKDQK